MDDLKKHVVLYVAIAIVIITVAFTASYAFFSVIFSGNENAKTTTAVTGNLAIDFTTSRYIDASSLTLIKDSDKESRAPYTAFTIKPASNSTVASQYNLYLTELTISDNFKSADFKWELLKNGTIVNSGDYTSAITGEDILLTSSPQTLESSSTGDEWIFRTWLSETDQDQLSLTNGSFSAKVKVIAVVNK